MVRIFILNQSALINPAGCTTLASYHLPASASEFSRSMLMAAYVANKKVRMTIYGGGCSNNRPQVVAVSFSDA